MSGENKTIHFYSHINDTTKQQAAAKIDRRIGSTEVEIPRDEERIRVDTLLPDFEPYKPKHHKSGAGCVTMISDYFTKSYTHRLILTEIGKVITHMPRHERNARKSWWQ